MPSRLGRYAVRRRIGSGGFATVWLAYDEQLDSPVAVKVLADNWTEDNHVRGRFIEEGRFLRKVESPHVVTVYDAGELDDGRPYLVMSYADQGTLADRLEVEGLTVGQSHGGGAADRARAAGAARPRRAAPRREAGERAVPDPRPASGVDRGDVRAMLGDLGLGKALDMSSRLTMIAGTPTFVAPEQAQGEPLDGRADQYSLAALTYLLFTGRAPYAHATLAAAAAPGEPPALSAPGREFPERGRAGRAPRALTGPRAALAGRHVVRRGPACGPRRRRAAGRCRRPGCRWTRSSPSRAPDRRRGPTRRRSANPTPPPPRRHRRLAAACAGIGALVDGCRRRVRAVRQQRRLRRPCPTTGGS